MKIVVAVDGSWQAALAARWTAHLPLTSADEVVVASVAERPVVLGAWGYSYTQATEAFTGEAWTQVQGEARRAVEEGAALLAPASCRTRAVVLEGHPIPGLTELIATTAADLVVVGPHGHGRLESILIGSVSHALLHSMPTSVLVAREPVRAPMRVLLATDGSPHSLAAARFLARFPLPPETRIDVLVVVDRWPANDANTGSVEVPDRGTFERTRAGEIIGDAVAALEEAGRTGTRVIRQGHAKREILGAARELGSDLIVTGSRGIGGFRGLLLGSVSRAVSKAAPCSTLVVAHGGAPASNDGRR
jgi:nucleotide-binding universal stress UspA family protein